MFFAETLTKGPKLFGLPAHLFQPAQDNREKLVIQRGTGSGLLKVPYRLRLPPLREICTRQSVVRSRLPRGVTRFPQEIRCLLEEQRGMFPAILAE